MTGQLGKIRCSIITVCNKCPDETAKIFQQMYPRKLHGNKVVTPKRTCKKRHGSNNAAHAGLPMSIDKAAWQRCGDACNETSTVGRFNPLATSALRKNVSERTTINTPHPAQNCSSLRRCATSIPSTIWCENKIIIPRTTLGTFRA